MLTPSTFIMASLILATQVQSRNGLTLQLSGPTALLSADAFRLDATLRNTGDETLTLLNDPNSVLSPQWKTETFSVRSRKGVPATFANGVNVQWDPSLAYKLGNYTVLAPGEEIKIAQKLDKLFDFADSGSGLYDITAKQTFYYASAEGTIASIDASSAETYTIWLWGTTSPTPEVSVPLKKRQGYVACSTSRQTIISSAVSASNSYINESYQYLLALNASSPRYKTWFGTYTAQRKAIILATFKSMLNDPSTMTYDCSCTDADTIAYVYPDQAGYMYLCQAYWSLPSTGVGSRAGTIVHENAYFVVNGGAQDYVYGETACKALAASNPLNAIKNAENIERFAVNYPPLA